MLTPNESGKMQPGEMLKPTDRVKVKRKGKASRTTFLFTKATSPAFDVEIVQLPWTVKDTPNR